ncbi:MAG: DMT family transporter [Asticcacaulis sp.]|uniref:DMT family transporter n=1 Tax=Asticcacaulis sp. TaxID=1872648 RepID=UPI0039E533DF
MDDHKELDSKAMGLMVALTATWGLQQVALKLAASDMAPVFQIALRSGVATLLIGGLALFQGAGKALRPLLWPGLLAGLFFALEFLLVGEGLKHTDASRMSIYLYTAPVFTALGLHFVLPNERLKGLQWLGIALAFAGVVTAFLGRDSTAHTHNNHWIGDLMGVGAGLALAATTLTIRFTPLSSAPATVTLFYQLLVASLLLGAVTAMTGQTHAQASLTLIGSLAFQTFIVCSLSFLVWFSLLRTYLASRLTIMTFLTPVFGVLFGVVLLKEPLGAGFIAGAVMVLAGIVLVSRKAVTPARLRSVQPLTCVPPGARPPEDQRL